MGFIQTGAEKPCLLREVLMNRILKKLFIVLFAVVAVACIGVAAACTEDTVHGVKGVTVTLVGEDGASQPTEGLPGDPLPVVNVENKDFEGYWTDSSYTTLYTETVFPESDITLYYKLHDQFYTLTVDYGNYGSFDYGQIKRGDQVKLPSLSPEGSQLAGFTRVKGGEVEYKAGASVANIGEKDEKVTLYAVWTLPSDADFEIEDGVITRYNGDATELVLPSSATSVKAGAFRDNPDSANITSLVVPENYTSIECGAFEGLDSLQSLTVPFIGGSRTQNRFLAYVFGAEEYTDNTYSIAVYTDGQQYYTGNPDISDLLIPETLTTVRVTESVYDIAEGAFYCALSLENLVLDHPEDLVRIGTSAFEACYTFGYNSSLGYPVSPEWLSYVKYIGTDAFRSYTGDHDAEAAEGYEVITYDVPLNSFTYIPELTNVETIGAGAFYYCAMLGDVQFGKNLRSIGDEAFRFTSSLTSVRFPDSLKNIGDYGFTGSGVTVAEFGTGISSIGSMAFAQCTSLEEVIFRGGSVPMLVGGQSFNNDVEQSVTDGWNLVLNEGFKISVPSTARDSFITAPDWAEYIAYVNPGQASTAEHGMAYWSYSAGEWNVSFEFTGGNTVFVNDPDMLFLTSIGLDSDTANSFANRYYFRYEVLTADEYKNIAGADAKPLYGNQTAVRMWNSQIASDSGEVYDFYFIISELPYRNTADNSRVLVPVLVYNGLAGAVIGDAESEGSFVITFNAFGVPQLCKVTGGALVPEADVSGAAYSEFYVSEDATTFTIIYYDANFRQLGSRSFFLDDNTASGLEVPLREVTGDNTVLLTNAATFADAQVFLKGDGTAYVAYTNGGVRYEYTATATAGSVAAGAEGYTVSLSAFKDMQGADDADLTGSVTLYGFDGTDYARVDLTVGDFSCMIMNIKDIADWQFAAYNAINGDVDINMPVASDQNWRYTSLSDPEVTSSYEVYTYNGLSYYRHLDADGNVTDYGTAVITAGGITFTPAGGTAVQGSLSNGVLTVGGTQFTYCDESHELTLGLDYDDGSGYTIKTDGYGNMLIVISSGTSTAYALGTYEVGENIQISGIDCLTLNFTGKQVNASGTVIYDDEIEYFIPYLAETLTSLNMQGCAKFSAVTVGPFVFSEPESMVVNDAFGYKKYEIAYDEYGLATITQFTYEIGADGNPVYTEVACDVASFEPVTYENSQTGQSVILYYMAVSAEGEVLFSIYPSGAEDGHFVIVYDGGMILSYPRTEVTFDVSSFEQLSGEGEVFGTIPADGAAA